MVALYIHRRKMITNFRGIDEHFKEAGRENKDAEDMHIRRRKPEDSRNRARCTLELWVRKRHLEAEKSGGRKFVCETVGKRK